MKLLNPTEGEIDKIVCTSNSWSEVQARINEIYGESDYCLSMAEVFAKKLYGDYWNDTYIKKSLSNKFSSNSSLKSNINIKLNLTNKSMWAIKLMAGLLIFSILFPPFKLTVNGADYNQGFLFIGTISSQAKFVGIVQYELLFLEFLAILIVGFSFVFLFENE